MLDECSIFEPLCDVLLKGNGRCNLYQNLILRWWLIRDVETVFFFCMCENWCHILILIFQDFGSRSG